MSENAKKFVPFPLWRLSANAREIMFAQFEVGNSIVISLQSKLFLQNLNVSKIHRGTFNFHFSPTNPKLMIESQDDSTISFITQLRQFQKRRLHIGMKLNGIPTEIDIHHNPSLDRPEQSKILAVTIPDYQNYSIITALENSTKHLFGFLVPQKTCVYFTDKTDFRNLFCWNLNKPFTLVSIGRRRKEFELNEKDMEFALKGIDTYQVEFGTVGTSSEKITEVLHEWKQSGEKFKMDIISFSNISMYSNNYDRICREFNAVDSDFSNDDIASCPLEGEAQIVPRTNRLKKDITKEDGKKATIIFQEQNRTTIFIIIFWTEKNLRAAGRILNY